MPLHTFPQPPQLSDEVKRLVSHPLVTLLSQLAMLVSLQLLYIIELPLPRPVIWRVIALVLLYMTMQLRMMDGLPAPTSELVAKQSLLTIVQFSRSML